jgi:hypothetical protein
MGVAAPLQSEKTHPWEHRCEPHSIAVKPGDRAAQSGWIPGLC